MTVSDRALTPKTPKSAEINKEKLKIAVVELGSSQLRPPPANFKNLADLNNPDFILKNRPDFFDETALVLNRNTTVTAGTLMTNPTPVDGGRNLSKKVVMTGKMHNFKFYPRDTLMTKAHLTAR